MVVTNKFYLAFFDSTGSTPLYLPLRRGDFLSLQTTFFDKLNGHITVTVRLFYAIDSPIG